MEKPKGKDKIKKPPSKSNAGKRKTNNGPTCSMFLGELTKKLALKKKQEEQSKNIVHLIIENITNALPIKFSKQSAVIQDSPTKIEALQSVAPELISNDTLNLSLPALKQEDVTVMEIIEPNADFKMPKMPLVNSEVFKHALEKRKKISVEDVAVNTGGEHDVASEIAKHVGTLKKISLIAEEFNQKTAKNLKEIVDSVQEDLIKKLEEIKAQQKLTKAQTFRIEEGIELTDQ